MPEPSSRIDWPYWAKKERTLSVGVLDAGEATVSPGMRAASWIILRKSFDRGHENARVKQTEHSGLAPITLYHVCSFGKEGRVCVSDVTGITACKLGERRTKSHLALSEFYSFLFCLHLKRGYKGTALETNTCWCKTVTEQIQALQSWCWKKLVGFSLQSVRAELLPAASRQADLQLVSICDNQWVDLNPLNTTFPLSFPLSGQV